MSEAVFTVGHSTRPFEDFLALLDSQGIERVIDVRRIPASRKFPQYASATLRAGLAEAGIDYTHCLALGGRRSRSKDIDPALNAFWTNDSFHNYADYAMTEAFQDGLGALLVFCGHQRCAIMCAEALWWRCHRRIIADYLLARGLEVSHILSAGKVDAAQMTPAARRWDSGSLVYPAEPATT